MHRVGNLTASERNLVYIFTLPPPSVFNCSSSTVVGFQYCYLARNSDVEERKNRKVFDFLSLVLSSSNDSFTVNARYSIRSRAQDNRCTLTNAGFQICCQRNNRTPFPMPPSFGIGIQGFQFQLLTFVESNTEYVAEQYQLNHSVDWTTNILPIIDVNQVDKPLPLLRIFGK